MRGRLRLCSGPGTGGSGHHPDVTLILTRGGEALTLTSGFAAALTEERDYTWEELMALTAALENEAGGDKEDTAGTEITVAGPGRMIDPEPDL